MPFFCFHIKPESARLKYSPGGRATIFRMIALPVGAFLIVLSLVPSITAQVQPANTGARPEPLRDPRTGTLLNYEPIKARQLGAWYLRETGQAAIGGAVFSAAWGTAWGSPREYPATWEHFGKRWALSISGSAIGTGMEAGFATLWGEDPRYFRIEGPFKPNLKAKIKNVLISTVTATNRDGERMPAYARYIGISGNNFMQMAWRPESQSSVGDAFVRMGYGLLSRMGANAFEEFLPDVRKMMERRKKPNEKPGTGAEGAP